MDIIEEEINVIVQLNFSKRNTKSEIALYTEMDHKRSKAKNTMLNYLELDSKYKALKNELSITNDGVLIKRNKIVIPESLGNRIIALPYVGHRGMEKSKLLLTSKE